MHHQYDGMIFVVHLDDRHAHGGFRLHPVRTARLIDQQLRQFGFALARLEMPQADLFEF